MKPIKRSILIILLLLATVSAWARDNNDLMKAKYYYDHYAYFEAIPYFEKIVTSLNVPEYYYELAECYKSTGNFEKAATNYALAVGLQDCPNDCKFNYGRLLMQLGRYDEAKKWLVQYKQTVNSNQSNDPKYNLTENLIKACNDAPNLLQEIPNGIALLMPFNTDGSDFAPAFWKGNLVFASDTVLDLKKKTSKWSGKAYYNIYALPADNKGNCKGEWQLLAESKKVNIKYHNGPCTFSADGKIMYYTRTRFNDGFLRKSSITNKDESVLLEIMIANNYDSVTKQFKTITPFPYNSERYSVAHPSISPDGEMLVFSGNGPGSYGGNDIYSCKKTKNGWSEPKNMGRVINSPGDDVFPYWADDTTLYFSSDGHCGLGGLDIYKLVWNRMADSARSMPINMGTPINSSYDDISLTMKADGGSTYFSSNRPAIKAGDNIYFYKKQIIYLKVVVLDSLTRMPVNDASITLDTKVSGSDSHTAASGNLFKQLRPGSNYMLQVSKDDYSSYSEGIDAKTEKEVDTIVKQVILYQPPARKIDTALNLTNTPGVPLKVNVMDTPGIRTFELNHIYEVGHLYYDFNKYDLKPEHKPYLDTMLALLRRHPDMRIEIRAHTDCRGSYELNQVLSKNRALAVVNFLVKNGIARNRMEYVGLGFSEPTIKCPECLECTEAEHYLNRLLEFRVLEL